MDNERSTDVGVSSANGEKNLSAQEKEWVNTFLSWNSSARRKVFNHLLNESIDFRHLVLSSELVSGSASAVSFTEDVSSRSFTTDRFYLSLFHSRLVFNMGIIHVGAIKTVFLRRITVL